MAACVLLAACGRQETPAQQQEQAVVVRTAPVRAAEPAPLVLSGTVRARYESPLAFQVGGQDFGGGALALAEFDLAGLGFERAGALDGFQP